MYKDIVKIREERKGEKSEYLIFTSKGMLIALTPAEFKIFNQYGRDENINLENKDFLSKLCSYQVLEFKDFKPKEEKKDYDLSLLNNNSDKPMYPAPILAHLSITNKCNMACSYCSVRKLNALEQSELSTEKWKEIISLLARWGVFQIGFTGGEPTLRKDLPELAAHVQKEGCVFNLTTNGWFLDELLISKLIKSGMKQCQLSLDSHIPKIHDFLRGEGSFKRAVKSLRLLKRQGVAVGIDCVVSKNNISSIPEFINWMKKEKIPYLTLIKLKKGDLTLKRYFELAPDYQEYSKIIREICLRKENSNPNITLDCGSVSNLQAVSNKERLMKIPISGCPIGHHLICISSKGEVYACAALLDKRFCLGNVFKEDIKRIWKENHILKSFRLIKKKVEGKCRDCERIDLCRGGCRGIAYSISEKQFASDSTCMFKEVQK